MTAEAAGSVRSFGAVLLAGGKSTRMGRDKALLPLPDGRLLWQRQLAVLEALEPTELFISGPARDGCAPAVTRLEDERPGLGPLSGIAAALAALQTSHLVVLAIDMPLMTATFLRRLLDTCEDGAGAVPRHGGDGHCEPLAAVYPRACLPLATRQLQARELSLQSFVRAAGSLLRFHQIASDEKPLFANWNRPTPG